MFLAANPTLAGKSIHLEATWNGAAVTFDSDLTAEEELALQPPVTLSADGSADVTIFVDLHDWFTTERRPRDPASANHGQPNEGLVTDNIRHSFHAFEDENEDGRDDSRQPLITLDRCDSSLRQLPCVGGRSRNRAGGGPA
jgi:hypothetical protein